MLKYQFDLFKFQNRSFQFIVHIDQNFPVFNLHIDFLFSLILLYIRSHLYIEARRKGRYF